MYKKPVLIGFLSFFLILGKKKLSFSVYRNLIGLSQFWKKKKEDTFYSGERSAKILKRNSILNVDDDYDGNCCCCLFQIELKWHTVTAAYSRAFFFLENGIEFATRGYYCYFTYEKCERMFIYVLRRNAGVLPARPSFLQ